MVLWTVKSLGKVINIIFFYKYPDSERSIAIYGCKCGQKIFNKAAMTEPRQKKHLKTKRKMFFLPPRLLLFKKNRIKEIS